MMSKRAKVRSQQEPASTEPNVEGQRKVNPIKEQQKLREINSRFRRLLEAEQDSNAHLEKSLTALQLGSDAVAKRFSDLDENLQNAFHSLVLKSKEYAHLKEKAHLLEEPDQTPAKTYEAQDAYLDGVKQLLKEYEEKYKLLCQQANQLIAQRDQLANSVTASAKILEQESQKMDDTLSGIELLNFQNNQRASTLDYAIIERNALKNKLASFGTENVDDYFTTALNDQFAAAAKKLEEKYASIHDEQIKERAATLAKKLAELKQKKDEEDKNKSEQDKMKDALANEIEAVKLDNAAAKKSLDSHKAKVAQLKQLEKESEKEATVAKSLLEDAQRKYAEVEAKFKEKNKSMQTVRTRLSDTEKQCQDQIARNEERARELTAQIEDIDRILAKIRHKTSTPDITLDPEINTYNGLVKEAEINFSPPAKKRARVVRLE